MEEYERLLAEYSGQANLVVERKSDLAAKVLLFIFGFLGSFEAYIILPSAFANIEKLHRDESDLGLLLCSFELAAAAASFIYGLLADRMSIKPLLLLGAFLLIAGNVLYAVSETFPFLIIGRTLAGLGAGVNTVGVSYLSSTTPVATRAHVIGVYWVVSLLGMVVGPACTLPLSYVNWKKIPTPDGFFLSDTNVPGWLNAVVTFLVAVPTLFIFSDKRKKKDSEEYGPASEKKLSGFNVNGELENGSERYFDHDIRSGTSYKLDWIVYFFIAVGFWQMFTLNVFQTIVTPETKLDFNWGPREDAYMFMIVGAVVVFTIFMVQLLLRCLSERVLLIIGELLLLGGLVVFCFIQRSHLVPFVIAVGLLTFGFSVASSILPSLYSKYIHPLDHGKWLGIMSAAQGIAQVLGPLFGGFVMSRSRELPMYLLTGFALLFTGATLGLFKKLKPDPYQFGDFVAS